MPELPKLATVDLVRRKLFVDGVEFPWHISEDGARLDIPRRPDDLRRVTLTFYAERGELITGEEQETAGKPQVAPTEGGE